MAKTVKDYFLEIGVRRELALEMDEITLAIHSRISRFNKQGVEKNLVMIDMGKYRHLEQKSPKNLQELHRMALDYGVFIVNFHERVRLLELFGLVKLNAQTAEYEFTTFGQSFFEPKRV